MYRSIIKNFHPFYNSDDGDDLDINSLLFGDSSSTSAGSGEDLFAVPELKNIDALSGDELDSALEALLAADGQADGQSEDTPSDSLYTEPAEKEKEDERSFLEESASVPADETDSNDRSDMDMLLSSLGGGDDFEDDFEESAPEPQPVSAPVSTDKPAEVNEPVPPPLPEEELAAASEIASEDTPPQAVEPTSGADIDALLASLGSGDDTTILSGVAEVVEPEITGPEITGPQSTDDVLERLLSMDENAGGPLELKSLSVVTNTAVFQNEDEPGDEWSDFHFDPDADSSSAKSSAAALQRARPRRKPRVRQPLSKRIAAMSVPKFLAGAFIILLLILACGAGVLFGINRVYAQRLERSLAYAHITALTLPSNLANYNHFITVNRLAAVGNTDFFLRRLTISSRATLFHFDNIFDPADYTFILTDQNDNFYMRLTQDFEYDLTVFPDRRNTVLQFSPLKSDASEFTLYVQNKEGQTESFYFRLREDLAFPATVHVNTFVPLLEDIDDRFVIANAAFSNTGSEFVYLIRDDPIHGAVTFDKDTLRMREGARNPAANRPVPVEYAFPEHNRTLGRITFGPVRNLDTGAILNFRDVYVSYPMPDGFIDIPRLFRDTPEDEQRLSLSNYTLVLERMGTQGPFVILVFHAIDEYGQRVQTEIVADLIIYTDDDTSPFGAPPIVIPGQNFFSAAAVGTDLFFDTREYGLDIIRASDLRLDVEAVQMRLTEAQVNLHLREYDFRMAPIRGAAEYAIKTAFASRLAYRSGQHGFAGIRGFSGEVLNNRAVMRHYTPVTVPDGNTQAVFDVQVVAGSFAYADLFLAVVEEEWILYEHGIFSSTRNTHQVVAQLIEDNWVIVSNRVIS